MFHYKHELVRAKAAMDNAALAKVYGDIANVFRLQHLYDKAVEFYRKQQEHAKLADDSVMQARALDMLGMWTRPPFNDWSSTCMMLHVCALSQLCLN